MKKTGIMGGTFDPIHIGHLWLAENALDEFALDEVIFIPSGLPYLKGNALDTKTRVKMTAIAIADNPRFTLSDIEAKRDGNSYSYETIAELRSSRPDDEFFFLVGADSLYNMESWVHPEIIFKECVIAVAKRDGDFTNTLDEKIGQLKNKFNADIRVLPVGQLDISSTVIRDRIILGKTVRYMVLDKIIDYVNKNEIYTKLKITSASESEVRGANEI